MTFANVGTLRALPGKRDEVIAILVRPNKQLREAGCLLYEVGSNDDAPDTVFVAELWESADAHQASLQLESVRAAIPKLCLYSQVKWAATVSMSQGRR